MAADKIQLRCWLRTYTNVISLLCYKLSSYVQAMIDDGKLELLQEMYKEWPFFGVTLDMIEMVFAKVIHCAVPSPHCISTLMSLAYSIG